jgi:hypothetical protein
MRGMEISKEEVGDALASEFNREDPFDIEERPEAILEGQPQLIVARPHEDGVLFLFAIAMRKGQAIHNFKATSVVEDDFFPVIFRPELGLFEVRASADQARRLRRTWLRQFAASLGAQCIPVSIPYSDLRLLHGELNASSMSTPAPRPTESAFTRLTVTPVMRRPATTFLKRSAFRKTLKT